MTKQEFIQEAALRLITSRPDADLCAIAVTAKELADEVFGSDEETEDPSGPARPSPTFSDPYEEPIETLIREVERIEEERVDKKKSRTGYYYQVGGMNVRIANALKAVDVKTIGDLLRLGHREFVKLRTIGPKCLDCVNEALENLYNIQKW